jgi:D-amino peptidase
MSAIGASVERSRGEPVRVHVISDIEGVSGVVKPEQGDGGEPLFEEARKLYTEEINAAVRGAKAAGATEIVVMDCHGAGKGWDFNSLLPEQLDPDCDWVVQDEWTGYTDFLEEGCDAALFVGMHARAGTGDGVLNHTVSGSEWHNLSFNGTLVGETGINAALCGTWGCPVLMVTGDTAACREAEELLGPGLVTVPVKQGLGRFSARNIPPVRARALIEEGAKKALGDLSAVKPYDPGRPCEIEVEYTRTNLVEKLRHRHGVEVLDSRRIVSRADDWWSAWKQFYF